MTLAALLTEPCTILKRSVSGVDRYGNPTRTSEPVESRVCLQQQQRSEDGAEISFTTWLAIFEVGTEIDRADQLVVDGETYEFVGEPWTARIGSPTVWHVEATVKLAKGGLDATSS